MKILPRLSMDAKACPSSELSQAGRFRPTTTTTTIRRLWIEALAGTAPEATEEIAAAKEQAQSEYQFVLAVTKEAGQDKQLADALFRAFRGYYLSSIEDPEHWPAERAQEAVLKVLDMLDKRAR